ncbi:MAG: hypothetical protein M3Z66_21390 [Chloroflexota bacterium]|nr:hypothetical protein [Chloroflexota bacterium]
MIPPEPVIIDQDDQTEIRVQAATHGTQRRLDIRVWRRGAEGSTPSRTALTVEAEDLPTLQQGLQELLLSSNGGQAAARVVQDNDQGRRLRAETTPFGTRYLAKLAFWQRVRDTWRPVDDGLVLAADLLSTLQAEIEPFTEWMQEPAAEVSDTIGDTFGRQMLNRWPTSGADWLTVEGNRVALHPRGLRITAEVVSDGERHSLLVRQWTRGDSLWLPNDGTIDLTIIDVDGALTVLGELADAAAHGDAEKTSDLICTDGPTLRIRLGPGDQGASLTIEQHAPSEAEAGTYFEPRLSVPVEHLPWLGRMLLQGGSLLAGQLSEEERAALQPEVSSSVAAYAQLPQTPAPEIAPQRHGHAHSAGTEALKRIMFGTVQAPSSPVEAPSTVAQRLQITDEIPAVDGAPEQTEAEVELEIPLPVHLGEVHLGDHRVSMELRAQEPRGIALCWENRTLVVPLARMESVITVLRDLYYNTLRGQRGLPLAIADEPTLTVSVHNQGTQVYFALRHEQDGAVTRLTFPAGEVPVFLDAARAALAKIREEDSEHESRDSDQQGG